MFGRGWPVSKSGFSELPRFYSRTMDEQCLTLLSHSFLINPSLDCGTAYAKAIVQLSPSLSEYLPELRVLSLESINNHRQHGATVHIGRPLRIRSIPVRHQLLALKLLPVHLSPPSSRSFTTNHNISAQSLPLLKPKFQGRDCSLLDLASAKRQILRPLIRGAPTSVRKLHPARAENNPTDSSCSFSC